MPAAEPSVLLFRERPWQRWLPATRPAFLLASAVPAGIGLAAAAHDGIAVSPGTAVLAAAGAVLAHAAVNVLNDYYDALNGSDAANTERLYPFTGGSRFIQNGVLTPVQTRHFGVLLVLVTVLAGLCLLGQLPAVARPGLLGLGLAGLLVGWAYSAPPLALNSRGLGELSVATGFGVLVPLGVDYTQRGAFAALPVLAGLPYALLVANLLFINQFPDWRADAQAGKRHWVVRLGPTRARVLYGVAAVLAYAVLATLVAQGRLPPACLLGLLPAPLSVFAAWRLWQDATRPQRLVPAIRATVVALVLHGVLVAVGLWLA